MSALGHKQDMITVGLKCVLPKADIAHAWFEMKRKPKWEQT